MPEATIPPAITAARIRLIQIGESTHHHDQSITSVSFKMMNTMVRRPVKPMPPLLLELLLIVSPYLARAILAIR